MTAVVRHARLAPVIAHRGASGDAPENTLAALSMAADHGASCVEIDVSISADHIAFVHHDHTLQRCTSGTGELYSHTAEALDQLDASKNMPLFRGEPLPRLTAVLDLLIARGLGLNLEIKPRPGLESATVAAIRPVIEQQWPQHLPLVFSSFSRDALAEAKAQMPSIARALLFEYIPADWEMLVEQFACQNIHCDGSKLKTEQTRSVIQSGSGLYCYTVNDVTQAQRLLDEGVHGIFTDFPKRLLQQLEI